MTKTSVTLRLDDELLAKIDTLDGNSRTDKLMRFLNAAAEQWVWMGAGLPYPTTLEQVREQFPDPNEPLDRTIPEGVIFNPPGFGKRYDAGPIKVGKAEAQVRDPSGLGKWPETGKR